MSGLAEPVSIRILDKEYLVSCSEEEREPLRQAATFLNARMQALKNNGRVIGAERIAVMTALNLANELLAYKKRNADDASSVDSMIKRMRDKIDDALVEGRQLRI